MSEPVDSETAAPDRRRPATVGGKVYLVVLAIGVLGLTLVAVDVWRVGVTVLGGGLLVAAAARAVLSDFESGMLRVRSRTFDLLALTSVGAMLIVLAWIIPSQPPI